MNEVTDRCDQQREKTDSEYAAKDSKDRGQRREAAKASPRPKARKPSASRNSTNPQLLVAERAMKRKSIQELAKTLKYRLARVRLILAEPSISCIAKSLRYTPADADYSQNEQHAKSTEPASSPTAQPLRLAMDRRIGRKSVCECR